MKRKIFSTLFALVLVLSLSLIPAVPVMAATLTVDTSLADTPPNYHTIQAAIDAASSGDTINVAAGMYNESVVISTDDITLKGEAGAILDGTGLANGIKLSYVSGVTVEGFEIRDYYSGYGIRLWFASENFVKKNKVSGSRYGIQLYYESNFNEIRENEVSESRSAGIGLYYHPKHGGPSYNVVEENEVSGSAGYGIYLFGVGTTHNEIRGNEVSGSLSDGIALWANDNIVEGNEVSGSAKGIYISASNNVVKENEVSGGGYGIYLQGQHNVVEENEVSGSGIGIFLYGANGNLVKENEVSGSGSSGILLRGASANDNIVEGNEVSDSGRYGIGLILGASDNLIKENDVSSSGSYDLFHDLASTPNVWEDNTYGTKSGADIP